MSSPTRGWQIQRRHVVGAGIGTDLVIATGAVPRSLGRSVAERLPALTIRVTSSTEKASIMAEFAKRYNGAGRVVRGWHAQVDVIALTSGVAKNALAAGMKDPPQVWLPTSSMWLRLLEHEGHTNHRRRSRDPVDSHKRAPDRHAAAGSRNTRPARPARHLGGRTRASAAGLVRL